MLFKSKTSYSLSLVEWVLTLVGGIPPLFKRKEIKLNPILADILFILFGACLALFLVFIAAFIYDISNKKELLENTVKEDMANNHFFKCSRCGIFGDKHIIYNTSLGQLILCQEHYEEFDALRIRADEQSKDSYYLSCRDGKGTIPSMTELALGDLKFGLNLIQKSYNFLNKELALKEILNNEDLFR
jgi:hypothetical protein